VNRPNGSPQMVSCASCTTNCIAPVVEVARRRLQAERAVMTTMHAYTGNQRLVDGPSSNFRRGRAGAANLVPTSTGAAGATVRAVPELDGCFDGIAIRAPITVRSIADIIADPRGAVVDLDLTRVVDQTLIKIMAWYDNEWGFTHQMVREARTALGLPQTRRQETRP
ncbi:MAG: type I glyceraldehyde-3-phosphate dehydrogenase, partial [Nocardioidaceae bacterium]